MAEVQDRLTAIDGKLMVPSPSPASVFVDGIAVSADDAEREARVREAWEALDVDRQRRIGGGDGDSEDPPGTARRARLHARADRGPGASD
ncbi:hypothetical protein SAMN04488550_4563 [Gordonia malaquae]|uniref:hypothetical protein n=1 Tax=Gordonia malaquae TaxID=410332 RepID=UPI0008991B77|nr:hypothetical protein [Gordonia malaquae]SEE57137.1 hypothetical protein SAMN04488550_4563 [Gordonia malaquae]